MNEQFKTAMAFGDAEGKKLDEIFSQWFTIRASHRADDRRGIDRWFASKKFPAVEFGVQYKADAKAGDTGNLFIEVVSVDSVTPVVEGWAFKCDAAWIVIFIPQEPTVYILSSHLLRIQTPVWAMKYDAHPTNVALNDGYRTHGLCVPRGIVAKSTVCLWYKDYRNVDVGAQASLFMDNQ